MSKITLFAIAAISFASVFAGGPTIGAKAAQAKPVAVKEAAKPAADKVDAKGKAKAEKATVSSRQCKGVTLDGARCKHKALEGKDFCAQHADQATKYQCKAMTAEGKQCQRNAAPRCFFCAQHEAGKKLADPKQEAGQCRAFTDEGKQCTRKAAPGWRYCDQHRK